uniref:Uncharacterized protein n=1 Tax=Timema douglasi TaxID=61478 RepID=A0A7R8VKM5_TIMDO|nr:unnamed protein product [Timema douglasi]
MVRAKEESEQSAAPLHSSSPMLEEAGTKSHPDLECSNPPSHHGHHGNLQIHISIPLSTHSGSSPSSLFFLPPSYMATHRATSLSSCLLTQHHLDYTRPRPKLIHIQVVCELHFQNNDIQKETECYAEKTGKKITVSLKRPRLQVGAIPSQLPNCPEYLSSSRPTRENVDQRRERIDNDNLRRAIAQSVISKETYDEMKVICQQETPYQYINNIQKELLVAQRQVYIFNKTSGETFQEYLLVDDNLQVVELWQKRTKRSDRSRKVEQLILDEWDIFCV